MNVSHLTFWVLMGLAMTPSTGLRGELKEVMSHKALAQFLAHSDSYCHLYYVSLLAAMLSSLRSDNSGNSSDPTTQYSYR